MATFALLLAGCGRKEPVIQTQVPTSERPMSVTQILDQCNGWSNDLCLEGTSDLGFIRSDFTPEQIQFLHEHIRELESVVIEKIQSNHPYLGSRLAGYFRIEKSLPALRHAFLSDTYFYGWEGPNYENDETYLMDNQYPHHIGYMMAIEAISCKPFKDAIKLTDEEIAELQKLATTRGRDPRIYNRARWLLKKCEIPFQSDGDKRPDKSAINADKKKKASKK